MTHSTMCSRPNSAGSNSSRILIRGSIASSGGLELRRNGSSLALELCADTCGPEEESFRPFTKTYILHGFEEMGCMIVGLETGESASLPTYGGS